VITPSATIEIAASPREVITFIADPDNAPRWMKALEVAELITPGPIGPGSQFREVQSAGGQRIETICEVVDYDGETRYAWKSVSEGPARYGGGFTALRANDGTELRYAGWATTTGPLARREEAWARQAQREAEAELAAIKAALEGG
jgi:Polyketide cyclase / dehydrase and lipid transport